MKSIKAILFVAILAVMTACGTSTRMGTYHAGSTQLNLMMSDLQYLGEAEVEVTYDTYLGVIRKTRTVNGQAFDFTHRTTADVNMGVVDGLVGKLRYAPPAVLNKYPEACYFQVVRHTKTVDHLFLGTEVKETALVRAYKIKDKIEVPSVTVQPCKDCCKK